MAATVEQMTQEITTLSAQVSEMVTRIQCLEKHKKSIISGIISEMTQSVGQVGLLSAKSDNDPKNLAISRALAGILVCDSNPESRDN